MPDRALTRVLFPLNGRWQLQPGTMEGPKGAWAHHVQVPSLVDAAQPGYDWDDYPYHWYRVVFTVPAVGQRDLAFLILEQSMFGTEAWLNGKHVGGNIACYTSQEYDVKEALRYGRENELLVRVGAKKTLPPESAVGRDRERTEFIPGIWGDVSLIMCGNPRTKLVQVIPRIESGIADVRITVENRSDAPCTTRVSTEVLEKFSKTKASHETVVEETLGAHEESTIACYQKIENLRLWSPDDPFLYDLQTRIFVDGHPVDETRTTFGMREFTVAGGGFLLNGKRVFLRGGNIAFHRFLSDGDRETLPWNLKWIKKILIDIPKAHNFNFFRSHLGQMYNRWYDIADEYGMMIQNEWQFWTTTGTREQIGKEFTQWLHDNWNHPSIVIWDALNECSDHVVQGEIVPEMQQLDPTRPWESVDFVEDHPYIYSLGPVLNERKFGFTRSLEEIEHSTTPSVVNEFLWWWIDKEGKPTELTQQVMERWCGSQCTEEEVVEHQSFLTQELVELFRRMRVDAIQPFVYLSNNSGPTAHWFQGRVKELQPKPIMKALRNAFSPFGISVELWDRHFLVNERRTVQLFVFNDEPEARRGTVRYGVRGQGGEWLSQQIQRVKVEGSGCLIIPVEFVLPSRTGTFSITAELFEEGIATHTSVSEKIAHIVGPVEILDELRRASIAVCDTRGEITEFFRKAGLRCGDFATVDLSSYDIIVVCEEMVRSNEYRSRLSEISSFVTSGRTLVVLEPECGIEGKQQIALAEGVALAIERRADVDRGGYDSYVFADDHIHPVWNRIEREHLKMFNGGFGGEVVSQHNVVPLGEHTVLARCGLKLGVIALCEIPFGRGNIIVSRLQLRGRLVPSKEPGSLYARRVDPVLQRYVLNLLSYAAQNTI